MKLANNGALLKSNFEGESKQFGIDVPKSEEKEFYVGGLVELNEDFEGVNPNNYHETTFFNQGDICEIEEIDGEYYLISDLYDNSTWIHNCFLDIVKE